MSEGSEDVKSKVGKGPLNNCGEARATAVLDTEGSKTPIQTHGQRSIFSTDQDFKMETISTSKATYVPPKSPGARLCGTRREFLKKQFAQKISEKIHAELIQPTPKTDYQSTSQRDFCMQGFVSSRPPATQVHDYKTDQAISFWSENYQQIQGVTGTKNSKPLFGKSSLFSTPISERLDELELPSDN